MRRATPAQNKEMASERRNQEELQREPVSEGRLQRPFPMGILQFKWPPKLQVLDSCRVDVRITVGHWQCIFGQFLREMPLHLDFVDFIADYGDVMGGNIGQIRIWTVPSFVKSLMIVKIPFHLT